MNIIKNPNTHNYFPGIILSMIFLLRLFIYYNTSLFEFSDYISYLSAIDLIYENNKLNLIHGNWLYLNSYFGYFFKYILGSLDYYFIFNCLIATCSSYIIYLLLSKLFNNRNVGYIYLIIIFIYTEYIALSTIFYTQIIEIFLISLIIYLLYYLYESKSWSSSLLYVTAIIFIIHVSFFFKGTMRYLWLVFLIYSFMNYSNRKRLFQFLMLCILLFGTIHIPSLFSNRYDSIINLHSFTRDSSIGFIFFGHTLYGGDGGEGTFIYDENRIRYDLNYQNWLIKKGITEKTQDSKINFMKDEIKTFITHHPFQWIRLQFYKFSRTFGIVPEGNTFQILFSGLFKFNWIFTSLFLQIPFILIIISFILCFDLKIIKIFIYNNYYYLWSSLFIYWILGSIFYGPFQERYRIPIMVLFIIPILSYLISIFSLKNFLLKKRLLIIKLIVITVIFSVWAIQAYEALIINKDRYFNYVHSVRASDEPLRQIKLWE